MKTRPTKSIFRIAGGTVKSVMLAFALMPTAVSAQMWSPEMMRADWKSFSFGVLTGIATHEAGHLALAKLGGHEAEFDGITIVYPGEDLEDDERLRLASAGFQTQWILSESLLQTHERRRQPMNNFNAGVVSSHILISAAYLTVLYDHEDGDLTGISEATGWSKGLTAAWLALPAALDTWRLMGKSVPDWIPRVSLMSKGLGITAIWTF